MEYADTLYGITMQESGVSKLVSVKLTNNEELIQRKINKCDKIILKKIRKEVMNDERCFRG